MNALGCCQQPSSFDSRNAIIGGLHAAVGADGGNCECLLECQPPACCTLLQQQRPWRPHRTVSPQHAAHAHVHMHTKEVQTMEASQDCQPPACCTHTHHPLCRWWKDRPSHTHTHTHPHCAGGGGCGCSGGAAADAVRAAGGRGPGALERLAVAGPALCGHCGGVGLRGNVASGGWIGLLVGVRGQVGVRVLGLGWVGLLLVCILGRKLGAAPQVGEWVCWWRSGGKLLEGLRRVALLVIVGG